MLSELTAFSDLSQNPHDREDFVIDYSVVIGISEPPS